MIAPRLALVTVLASAACTEGGGGNFDPVTLDGELGFDVSAAVAIVCPPDPQGQFMKVWIEGSTPDSTCDMDHPRSVPTTCEDRAEYMQQVPDICLGMGSLASPNLPMMDYLLSEGESGWTDLDYVPLIVCDDTGNEAIQGLYGNTTVSLDEDTLHLEFDLQDEEGLVDLLSGAVDVEVCP